MEALLLYFLKVNGLLIVFFLAYYLLLRKETFFQANRWFLLLGIVSSFILPLLTFTEIVWIDPKPIVQSTSDFVPINNIQPIRATITQFDWELFFTYSYALISILLFIKIGIEIISFLKIIKNGNKNKENNIVFVETDKSQNPFSFFNYLVFNKLNFTEEELNMIIIHEKVHIEQKHSFDVLIAKILCIILWINPIAWFYKKAILENLEFIADSKTSETTNNIYQYQKTLLKAVACNNQLSITNQFYQSLIKKRIVMLNTNQSNKRNVWKYTLVVPFLIAFIILFQFETVAQVRENSMKSDKIATDAVVVAIGFVTEKNATDSEMKSDSEELKKQGIDYKFSKIKRNKNGEIIAIKIEFKDNNGNKGVKEINGKEPIEPIYFSTENGQVGFTNEPNLTGYFVDEELSEKFGTEIKVKRVNVNDNSEIYLNGKKINEAELENIDSEVIKTVNVSNNGNKNVFIIKSKEDIEEDENVFFINDNEVHKIDVNNLDPNDIKTVNIVKGDKKIIKVITKNSAGIPDDTEIFINGKKVSQEEFDKLEQNEIALMNISNVNSKKRIEIQKKAKEEVEKEMKKIKIEWQEDSKKEEMKAQKAEMEKMKAELAKTRAELEKMKTELKKKN